MRFRYLAASLTNDSRSGLIEADSPGEALQILQREGLIVVRLEAESPLSAIWARLNQDISLKAPISRSELAALSQEWAGLVGAGITLEESLGFLISTSKPSPRRVLTEVREAVKGGASLYDALSQHPGCFPITFRTLIQAGEIAGTLDDALQRLAEDLIAQRAIREEARNALLYPAFLLTTASIGIATLLVVVVPNLENLFGSRRLETLPWMTQTVITLSHVVRDHGLLILLTLTGIVLTTIAGCRTTVGRLVIDRILLRTPVIGAIIRAVETGRFARSLGALLKGGVPVPRAMPLAAATVFNSTIARGLHQAHERIMAGASMGDAIAAEAVLPDDMIGLIRMGERTGRLDSALDRGAAMYEGRAARKLKAFTTVLTPTLTILFGLIAGIIIYAMLSTILSINDLAGA